MARNKDKAVKEGESQRSTGDVSPAEADVKTSDIQSGNMTAEDNQAEETEDNGGVIEPIAFSITLKALHPQATYGRCGYRFNKAQAVEIARQDLTDAQIIALAEDPYLDVVPITEE